MSTQNPSAGSEQEDPPSILSSLYASSRKSAENSKMPLYVAFIDLTKAFDLVSRKGLFRLLEKIGCPPKLRSMVVSFHENTKGTVVYDGSTSEPFPVCSGVKQGCVLAPALFGILFSLLLSYAFDSSSDGVYCAPDLMGSCSTCG